MDPVLGIIIAVLAFALGIFSSHATLGNKVTRALTLLEGLTRRVDIIENNGPLHFHRRVTDE